MFEFAAIANYRLVGIAVSNTTNIYSYGPGESFSFIF
jgi:hypothetical protein